MPGLLDGLSSAQAAAVTHPGGPLLVVAGAGTGKTRTLVRRVAWLVEQGVPADGVLALTFSSAAADEMRVRLEELVEPPYEELHAATFHSFCARLLHDEAFEAGLHPFFSTATAADRVALLLEHIDELTLRHHAIRGNPAPLIGSFVARIDRCKDEMVGVEDYRRFAADLAERAVEDAERSRAERELEFASVYADHDRLLHASGALDFGDLVLGAVRLLRERAHVRRRVGDRFRHVVVDEFQDVNFGQGTLLRLLAGEHRNVMVVGDDDQAIYRFRGASRKNLLDFRRDFPEAEEVRLERNHRSGRRILAAASAVVEPTRERIPKRLTGRAGGSVRFWRCRSERAQAQGVAAEVERLVAQEGVSPGEVAVLVRSVKAEGPALAAALEERALPFRLAGAAAYFQRAEVRDALAWLRALADPSDSGAVVRALSRPPVELRSVDIARLTQLARRRKLDMVAAVAAACEGPQLTPEGRERAADFLKLYRPAARAFEEMRPDVFVHRLIERIGLRRRQLFAAQPETVERLVNIAKLGELATAYVRRAPDGTTRDFARHVSAVAEAGLREEEATAPGGPAAVSVMTMHAAKGLEFDHVLVLGLSAGRVPGPRRRAVGEIPDELLHESLPEGERREAHEDEARRLVHVAMTRARRGLVLAFPETGGAEPSAGRPSALYEEARAAVDGQEEIVEEELFGPAEGLHSTFRMMRDEVLDAASRVGGRLSDMRLDTYLDVSQAMARYLELLKVSALIERSKRGQPVAEALPEVNDLLLQAAAAEQREPFLTSSLDDYLLDAERDERRRADALEGAVRALARVVHPAARRRADALGLGHRDLPAVPAEVQVRARLPHPAGAEHQPALRDPRPPGARALPHRGRRLARAADGAVRGVVGALGVRRVQRRPAVPLACGGGARALPRARRAAGLRARLVRALVRLPAGDAPAARAGGPGGPAARRLLRADRLQDGQAEDRVGVARGRPALALPDGREGVVAARHLGPELLLRARQRARPGRALRGGARARARDGGDDRRGDPGAGVRAHPVPAAVLVLRLPDHLPGGGEVGRCALRRHLTVFVVASLAIVAFPGHLVFLGARALLRPAPESPAPRPPSSTRRVFGRA